MLAFMDDDLKKVDIKKIVLNFCANRDKKRRRRKVLSKDVFRNSIAVTGSTI